MRNILGLISLRSKEVCVGQSNDVDNANGGVYSSPSRNGTFSDEAICAGLVGAANLKIAASTGGRGNRPYQKVSYVGRKNDAH